MKIVKTSVVFIDEFRNDSNFIYHEVMIKFIKFSDGYRKLYDKTLVYLKSERWESKQDLINGQFHVVITMTEK